VAVFNAIKLREEGPATNFIFGFYYSEKLLNFYVIPEWIKKSILAGRYQLLTTYRFASVPFSLH